MADAADSKSAGGNIVWVQLPPSALTYRPENSVKMRVKPHIYAVFSCYNAIYINCHKSCHLMYIYRVIKRYARLLKKG